MWRCGWVPKPLPASTVSSLKTRSAPQLVFLGSKYSAKLNEWCVLSQPKSKDARSFARWIENTGAVWVAMVPSQTRSARAGFRHGARGSLQRDLPALDEPADEQVVVQHALLRNERRDYRLRLDGRVAGEL